MTQPEQSIRIVPFGARHGAAFRALNVAWIRAYFALEPKDFETLDDPQGSILDKGGAILIAEEDGVPVGCVALIPHGADGTLELAKMAVSESHRGRKIGRLLMEHAIAYARAAGAPRLYLESNTRLAPAIRLYESVGFRRLGKEALAASPYARADIAMALELEAGG